MTTSTSATIETLQTVGESYLFLSNLYLRVPENNISSVLKEEFYPLLLRLENTARKEQWTQVLDALKNLLECTKMGYEGNKETLSSEFTRLFRAVKEGYGPIPPYESIFLGASRVQGDAVEDVLTHYQQLTILPTTDFGNEPPDHIAYELAFLGTLFTVEASGDASESLGEVRRDFVASHIATWIPEYCDMIAKEASEPFYRGVALLTKALVDIEVQALEVTQP